MDMKNELHGLLHQTNEFVYSRFSCKMSPIWPISVLWVALITALVGFFLIKMYLKSKPLGSQTLLDKLYVDSFNIISVMITFRVQVQTCHLLGYSVPETPAYIVSYLFRFTLDMYQTALVFAILINALLIYYPSVTEGIADKKIVTIFRVLVLTVASLTCLLAYFTGQLPLTYLELTQVDLPRKNSIQVVFTVMMFVLMMSHKVGLMFTRRTWSEGECNLFSFKVILFVIFLRLFGMGMELVLPDKAFKPITIYSMFVSNFYPYFIIYTNPAIKHFLSRKFRCYCSCYECMLPRFNCPYRCSRDNSVAPMIELNTLGPNCQREEASSNGGLPQAEHFVCDRCEPPVELKTTHTHSVTDSNSLPTVCI